jgi:hypothetical protein
MEELATDNILSDVAYGFYDEKAGKFKVSYTADERITFNDKSDKISQRSIAKGKVVTYYKRPELIAILDSLKEQLEERSRFDLEHIDSGALGTEELAITIEQALRILDMASAEEAIETGEERIKYLLYPYQAREGCRVFGFVPLPGGEVKGKHRSQLKTSSALINIDKCTAKPKSALLEEGL